jgi:hypothetical protein
MLDVAELGATLQGNTELRGFEVKGPEARDDSYFFAKVATWFASEVWIPEGMTSVIEVWEILYYLTEVFEFATRLSLKLGSESMTIEVSVNGLEGRVLVLDMPRRWPFDSPYGPPSVASLSRERILTPEELAANPRRAAGAGTGPLPPIWMETIARAG